jgi:hypothetical protein
MKESFVVKREATFPDELPNDFSDGAGVEGNRQRQF